MSQCATFGAVVRRWLDSLVRCLAPRASALRIVRHDRDRVGVFVGQDLVLAPVVSHRARCVDLVDAQGEAGAAMVRFEI